MLVLAGLILKWDAVLSLPLVPIFLWWIERHFIIAEEDRCAASSGPISPAIVKRHAVGFDSWRVMPVLCLH